MKKIIFYRLKMVNVLLKTISTLFLKKKLKSTDNLWEVRVQYGNNIFRLLGFFDGSELVVLNHAFTKKTQKNPQKEIKKAEQRKKDYFSQRRPT